MAIEFTLGSDQRRLRAAAREIAHDVLAGVSARTARLASPEERFAATRQAYQQLVEAGYLRKILPESAGGELRSTLDLALIAEELTAVDASVALTLFAVTLGLAPVVHAGTEAQQRAHLAKFLTPAGTPLAAFALSEPGGSANFDAPPPAEGVRTTAVREAGHWVIAGAKKWVSNSAGWDGTGPDLMSVVARNDPAAAASTALSVFLVTGPVSGLSVTGTPDTIGHRARSTPAISLAAVRVPEGNVVGDVGGGLKIVGSAFAPAAAQVGVFGLALMRAAFDHALRFAQAERRGGPVPIIDHQAVGYALASAKTRIEAVRSLTWRACHALDTGSPAGRELALHAKVFGSETAVAGLVSPFLVKLANELRSDQIAPTFELSSAVLDLFVAAFSEQLECESSVRPETRRHALILQIKAFIDARLDDPELTTATIAAAHYISPRYLQKLFEAEGSTVTDWIRRRRLDHCKRELLDPRNAGEPISRIAARWGLADSSHFSRLFRATYGMSPREFRSEKITLA